MMHSNDPPKHSLNTSFLLRWKVVAPAGSRNSLPDSGQVCTFRFLSRRKLIADVIKTLLMCHCGELLSASCEFIEEFVYTTCHAELLHLLVTWCWKFLHLAIRQSCSLCNTSCQTSMQEYSCENFATCWPASASLCNKVPAHTNMRDFTILTETCLMPQCE